MAEKRMFSKIIIDSDCFLDMPLSTQALYFHLSMRADDEGFINSPKKIQRAVGCTDDDLRLLIAKSFIIPFESGVIVIKHWKIHNTLRKDRTKATIYNDEKSMLQTDESGAYSLVDNQMSTNCQPNDNQLTTNCPHRLDKIRLDKIRLDKIRLDKISIDKCNTDISNGVTLLQNCSTDIDIDKDIEKSESNNKPNGSKSKSSKPAIRHKYGEYNNVLLSDEDMEKLKAEIPNYEDYINKLSSYMASTGKSYKNHLATMRNWFRKDKQEKNDNSNNSMPDYESKGFWEC